MTGLRTCSASQAYYGRKRNEGKGHKQALLVLALRRSNVLWAMRRDEECHEALQPSRQRLDIVIGKFFNLRPYSDAPP